MDAVAAVRRFNRFYTRQIGLLHETLLRSAYSLTEVRVLYELAHRERPTAGEIARELGLDAGYLSRILQSFERRKLIRRVASAADGRQSLLLLTTQGRKAYAPLDASASEEVRALLAKLPEPSQARLLESMRTIEELLGPQPPEKPPYILRPHQPGDMGWVVHRHGVLYAQEYGWNEEFEALVAKIVAKFIRNFDPQRERCWIAERDGQIAGSVFLVKKSATVAQLRLLLVEPAARGAGIGAHLVAECIAFARRAGYRKITLWTNSVLDAARHVYEKAGFRLVSEEPHHSFGHDLVGQVWDLSL